MSELESLINGRWTKQVSIDDRGLCYGDGLFETMRFSQGYIPLWPYHEERLDKGCKRLSLVLHKERLYRDLDDFLIYLKQTVHSQTLNNKHFIAVKIIVTRGQKSRGYIPQACEPTLILSAKIINHEKQAASLICCQHALSYNQYLAGIKHLSRLDYIIAAQELSTAENNVHGLLLDQEKNIIETLHHNIFLVKDNIIYTPSLDQCGVAGVVRTLILMQASLDLSLHIKVKNLSINELENADEIFMTNALHGITPVVQYGHHVWEEGFVTQKLMSYVDASWE